ncbi:hypothetical protein VRRI112168_19225 [Vreelandella rituensis]
MYRQSASGLFKGMNARVTMMAIAMIAITLVYGVFFTERLALVLGMARTFLNQPRRNLGCFIRVKPARPGKAAIGGVAAVIVVHLARRWGVAGR